MPRSHRFPGLHSNARALRDKYANCERSMVHGQNIRKLTPREIQQWHERMEQILGRDDRAKEMEAHRKAEMRALRERLAELEEA